VRAALDDGLAAEGWRGEAAWRVQLGLSEALTNAIEHGSWPGARVVVGMAIDTDRAVLRVADRGRPGAAPAWSATPPPTARERGRGILIMRSLAERCEARPSRGGTLVEMEFARAGLAGEDELTA
jgi:anti-sigma regulatory factor (Ser/Thr protein kinase)